MATELTTRTASALAAMPPALKAGLVSLTRRMGDPRTYRAPESLRLDLTRLGTDADVRGVLAELAAESPKAAVKDFAVHLGKLSLHYWRPDFTPDQAKQFNADFVSDLDGITADELAGACAAWRRNPANRFFPRPGELLALVQDGKRDRALRKAGALRLLAFIDGEPENAAPDRAGKPIDFAAAKEILERVIPKRDTPIATHRVETADTARELCEKIERRASEVKP